VAVKVAVAIWPSARGCPWWPGATRLQQQAGYTTASDSDHRDDRLFPCWHLGGVHIRRV